MWTSFVFSAKPVDFARYSLWYFAPIGWTSILPHAYEILWQFLLWRKLWVEEEEDSCLSFMITHNVQSWLSVSTANDTSRYSIKRHWPKLTDLIVTMKNSFSILVYKSLWNRITASQKNHLGAMYLSLHFPVLLMQISFDSGRKPAEMKAFVSTT